MTVQFGTLENGQTTATRRNGKTVSLRINGQVTNLAGATVNEWIDAAFSQLPAQGSETVIMGDRMKLVEANVRVRDVAVADVELMYEYKSIPGGSALTDRIRMGASLQQTTSRVDRDGHDVVVEFNDDKQGGEFDVLDPNATLSITVYEQLADPWSLRSEWIGKVNENEWAGGQPREWMCVGIELEPSLPQAEPYPEYRVTYEFQFRPIVGNPSSDPHTDFPLSSGWDPQVIYIDPETGRPPKGWQAQYDPNAGPNDPTSARTIQWYETKDFAEKFP